MTRGKYGKILFDKSEELYIVDNFTTNKKSIMDLIKHFGLSKNRNPIIRVLEKYNIDYKNTNNKFGRKYFFNEHYFENIDSKDKAYWLGFMYADGYISNKNMVGCGLKQDDEAHLIAFLKSIEISEVHIERSEKTNSSRFILCSSIMYNNLKNIGFSQTKSHDNTSSPFDHIPDQYKKDFILGFWDGDGYVSIAQDGKKSNWDYF